MTDLATKKPTTKKAMRKAEKRRRRERWSAQIPAVTPDERTTIADDFRVQMLVYLVALAAAEILTTLVDTRWGVIGHGAILAMLLIQAARYAYRSGADESEVRPLERRRANFLVALALAPLIRLVSLAMPLQSFPEITWYLLVAIPLLAAAWSAANACGYDRGELGLRIDWRPLPLTITYLIGISGVGLGYLEYRILQPDPLIDRITPFTLLAAAVILLVGTGFTEEFIFRGVQLHAGNELFGSRFAIVFTSLVFAVLHIGQRSPLDVIFVFFVAIAFALAVRWTRSLAGVTLAHGTTNFFLFVVFPHLLGKG